jgi:V/A-type H+-transporting ATPase subunit B
VIRPAPVEYDSIRSLAGPLMVVAGVSGVAFDEQVEVALERGEIRQGVVLDVAGDVAVVQLYQGSSGLSPARARARFLGAPLEVPVGEGWLGRVLNGRGAPLDDGPPVFGDQHRPVAGRPINPAARQAPSEPILTGISLIDGLATLVRGQKLPVFSAGGLPHLELATQIAAQATVEAAGESFRVVFGAMGVTHAEAAQVRQALESRADEGSIALFLNTADDPVIERILTPRIALTVAEHLAFDLGQHVLVVLADMTSYAEALREVAAARSEVPGRRGYPGYLYSDLASIFERSGRIRGRPGSITQVPVLTMPAGDITHPVPDLTGYITEGQLVLSHDVQARGVYPPLDPLGSLSRLMRRGAGPGRTRDDHLQLAAQSIAALATAQQVRELAELVGAEAMSETDRSYLRFAAAFDAEFASQGQREARPLPDTLDRAWRAVSILPRRELTMLAQGQLDAHYREAAG